MKLLDFFDTQTVLVSYMMHNGGNHNTIIKEAGKFLKKARDIEQKEANEGEFPYGVVIASVVHHVRHQNPLRVKTIQQLNI